MRQPNVELYSYKKVLEPYLSDNEKKLLSNELWNLVAQYLWYLECLRCPLTDTYYIHPRRGYRLVYPLAELIYNEVDKDAIKEKSKHSKNPNTLFDFGYELFIKELTDFVIANPEFSLNEEKHQDIVLQIENSKQLSQINLIHELKLEIKRSKQNNIANFKIADFINQYEHVLCRKKPSTVEIYNAKHNLDDEIMR